MSLDHGPRDPIGELTALLHTPKWIKGTDVEGGGTGKKGRERGK